MVHVSLLKKHIIQVIPKFYLINCIKVSFQSLPLLIITLFLKRTHFNFPTSFISKGKHENLKVIIIGLNSQGVTRTMFKMWVQTPPMSFGCKQYQWATLATLEVEGGLLLNSQGILQVSVRLARPKAWIPMLR